jgi:hypothetical protein
MTGTSISGRFSKIDLAENSIVPELNEERFEM